MPKDSDETTNIDELLAELKNETVEESTIPKKEDKKTEKPEWADKNDDDINTYEYSDKDVDDKDW